MYTVALYFTLGNPKTSLFQQYYSCILLIIHVISEENKLLPPYPPHLKNVTTLPCKMQNLSTWLKVMLHSTTLRWNSAHVATVASVTRPYRSLVLDTRALYSIQVRLYRPHIRWAWSKNQRPVVPSRVADAETAMLMQKVLTSGPHHCWRRVSLPTRQCASDTIELLRGAPWDTPVHQSWHVASHPSWPQPGRLPYLGHAARARLSSTTLRYGWLAEASWCDMGWISAQGDVQLISGEKDWKHVSVQKVVILNTCCDVACMTFQLPHITTGSFQSHQRLEECNITFSQMNKFCILQGSAVTFFRCGGKGITVCFLLRQRK